MDGLISEWWMDEQMAGWMGGWMEHGMNKADDCTPMLETYCTKLIEQELGNDCFILTVTCVWKRPKCSSVRGKVQSVDTPQGTARPPSCHLPHPQELIRGSTPCPPPHPTATQVLLGSPHQTGLSSGPHITQLPLLEDSVCSCLFSHKCVESRLCWVWDLQG